MLLNLESIEDGTVALNLGQQLGQWNQDLGGLLQRPRTHLTSPSLPSCAAEMAHS